MPAFAGMSGKGYPQSVNSPIYDRMLDRTAELTTTFARWFASRGLAPRAHQLELLRLARAGRSALLIAPTGAGKTLAGFLPTLVELSGPQARSAPSPHSPSKTGVNALLEGEGWGGGSKLSR